MRQVDAPAGQAAAQTAEIALFDFLSLDHVHLAFNEGYLRIVRAAYPYDHISFHAIKGHVDRLSRCVADLGNIRFETCKPFETSLGFSQHNPIAGRWAARQCLISVARKISGRSLRLAALLGVNANLLAVVGHGWPKMTAAPLHMILHGQLGEAMIWRSRNPFIRAGDLISKLRRPLPAAVKLVALELGVKEAILEISPSLASSIVILEHPILISEWAKCSPLEPLGKIRIGFVGHARRAKGFDVFAELARGCSRADIEFCAIGLSSPETDHLDIGRLARKPSQIPLPRQEYLKALAGVDLVCLPLHSRAYDFTGSGTVSDAIGALKPLIAFGSRTLQAIFAQYGRIGWLTEDRNSLFELVRTLDPVEFERQRSAWITNLKAIRRARSPQALAQPYASAIFGTKPLGTSSRPRITAKSSRDTNASILLPK